MMSGHGGIFAYFFQPRALLADFHRPPICRKILRTKKHARISQHPPSNLRPFHLEQKYINDPARPILFWGGLCVSVGKLPLSWTLPPPRGGLVGLAGPSQQLVGQPSPTAPPPPEEK